MSDPKVLICRLSAMGDCVVTTPMVTAIRAAYPNAFISWVVQKGPHVLLEQSDAIDRLVVVPKGFLKSPSYLMNLRRRLQAFNYDWALDPQSLSKSAIVGWLSGAKQRVGLANPFGRELAPWLNNRLIKPQHEHVAVRSLELLKPLGIESTDVHYDLKVADRGWEFAEKTLSGLQWSQFAVLNPGGTWDSCIWPAERFGKLAARLAEQNIPSMVVWAGKSESEAADQVVAASGGTAVKAPPSDLVELSGLLARATIYVGGDTGPTHMACALGTKTLGLHGATRPELSGALGPNAKTILKKFHEGNHRERRNATNAAMQKIDVDTVYQACCEQLADQQSSRKAA